MDSKEKRQVAETIGQQLSAQVPGFMQKFHVKNLVSLDDRPGGGLRLNTQQNSDTVNIDILYDRGRDTYIVKAYKFSLPKMVFEPKTVYSVDDIYFDQLEMAVEQALEKAKKVQLKAKLDRVI